MWHKTISISELNSSTSWKFERFRSDLADTAGNSADGISLLNLVRERDEIADPTAEQYSKLPYLGLDAVEPGTGEILSIRSASEQAIRSRSRVFREGDVLYGRLRAYLNKVAYIDSSHPFGTCSGEFFVLRPDTKIVYPRFLQWLLMSDEMVSYVKLRLAGATHPRLGIDDLMAYKVVLPTLKRQLLAIRVLEQASAQRRKLREELYNLPSTTNARVMRIAYS